MSNITYLQVQPEPGIQRDGTDTDCLQYIDGVWVRFYKGRAKKMGGYKVIYVGNNEIIRNLVVFNTTGSALVYIGQPSNISTITVLPDLTTSAQVIRTPLTYTANANNNWSITSVSYTDVLTVSESVYIVGVATPSSLDISNETPGIVYYGGLYDDDLLTPLINTNDVTLETAGCLLTLGNYLLILGLNGTCIYNNGVTFNEFPDNNQFTIGTSKFVYAAPVRNNGIISGLAWTLDGVVSITFDGISGFNASYVSTISTILSQNCVISYDPYFYWIGSNTFFMFNGAVIEIKNETNKLWFFENLNQTYANKVFGYVNKKYNELRWAFCYGDATENNWEIIHNMDTGAWYDTPISRSAGASSTTLFPYPLLADSSAQTYNLTTSYPLWAHEYGVNKVDPIRTTAILSYFTTNKLWLVDQNPQAVVLSLDAVIIDVKQTGSMFFNVNTQAYPNSTTLVSSDFVFDSTTEFLTVRVKGSLLSLTFTSNVLDGDYLFGKTMVRLEITDDQRPGASTV